VLDSRDIEPLDLTEVLDTFQDFENLRAIQTEMTITPGGGDQAHVLP